MNDNAEICNKRFVNFITATHLLMSSSTHDRPRWVECCNQVKHDTGQTESMKRSARGKIEFNQDGRKKRYSNNKKNIQHL